MALDTIYQKSFDRNRDVTLNIKDEQGSLKASFFVCSRVFTLASPVFEVLFSPNFNEGNQLAANGHAEIDLHEDKPVAMERILSLLHHRSTEDEGITAQQLATIALHCDKYDCCHPIEPWVSKQLNKLHPANPKDYGLTLLAAHYIGSPEAFEKYSVMAQKSLRPTFVKEWNQAESLSRMPTAIKNELLMSY